MPDYVYDRDIDDQGNHVVHTTTCVYKPTEWSKISLGWHKNIDDAIAEAKHRTFKTNFQRCPKCSNKQNQ